MSKKYIIGTRGSLLALTQCGQVKVALERLTGEQFELKVIKTQGDEDTSKPLWQLDGKDFFTKELDMALLNGEVDLVVHSYKDLGSERPEGIKLAAVTKRSYAHDIMLVSQSAINKLADKETFIVGTSSPRRITNIESSFGEYIPAGEKLKIKTKMLRGNVNTRIQKLRDGEFDAIVLALAGIERLAITKESRQQLIPLLDGLNFMVLPQSTFPSAASQGALGIEILSTREDNGELLNKLKLIHHTETEECVSRERKLFNSYGGGCHLAVGINVRKISGEFLHIAKGEIERDGIKHNISENYLENRFEKNDLPKNSMAFIGMPAKREIDLCPTHHFLFDEMIKKDSIATEFTNKDHHVFLTTAHGINSLKEDFPYKSIWGAGTKTMKSLAKKGFWTNGCADGLGSEELKNLANSQTIQILTRSDDNTGWSVLTNSESISDLGQTVEVYERKILETDEDYNNHLKKCRAFYWTSYPQFEIYTDKFPEIKEYLHFCGLGKTFETFKKHNQKVTPISSIEHFKNWFDQAIS